MPPLILHNVPDEELYTGEDGVVRPYAMVFPTEGNPTVLRARRVVPETGSFGKSTRRSRSRTGTPAAKREDPTLAAADAIFSKFLAQQSTESDHHQRKTSGSVSQPTLSSALVEVEGNGGSYSRYSKKEQHKEPTEVILRGFKSSQQYAAIKEYERIGGRICEDYPRDPPIEQRRYKSDLRDPASLRQKAMTAEEKSKALRFAGGEHWIKITFESAEAAEIAVENSPQTILNHLVYAELYRGIPPTSDEAVPVNGKQRSSQGGGGRQNSGTAAGADAQQGRRSRSTLNRTPSMSQIGRGSNQGQFSPESQASTQTIESGTIASTASSNTIRAQPATQPAEDETYCRKLPFAKRIQLLPAEQALLKKPSRWQETLRYIPILSWFTADFFGPSMPRTEQGEFDWAKASLYWKILWWIDYLFFGGGLDICHGKDD